MDFGDLQDYGLDINSSKCGGKTCLDKEKFKNLDESLSRSAKLGMKMAGEGAKLYKKVSRCHPILKDHVTPKVEGILTMFPLNLACWWLPCGLPCDFQLWCLPCWCNTIFITWDLFVTLPWNFGWMVIVATFLFFILGFQFLLALFGITVNLLPGVGGFGIF